VKQKLCLAFINGKEDRILFNSMLKEKHQFIDKLEEKEVQKTKNYKCELCGFKTFKGSGLASHIRAKHPEKTEKE